MKVVFAGLLTVLLAGSAQAQVPGGCQEAPGQGMLCSSPFTFANNVELTPVTVTTLPPCTTALKGAIRTVSDATAPTYNGALTGGGAVTVLVLCTGTTWLSH
jgi:hypothetical protein